MAGKGNSVGEAQEYVRDCVAAIEAMRTFSRRWEDMAERGCWVKSFTVRPPKEDDGDWMVVVRADVDNTPSVGFVSARDLSEVVALTTRKLLNGSVKWMEDQYANGR